MAKNTAPHILSTSANLLGFCLFVLTSLHITNYAATSIVDEFTSIIAMLLIFSAMFSFISIRTSNRAREKRLERIADYLFFASLAGILLVVFLITLNFIK